jgi:murein DD-endopeptidase MepM/ murein hydrolase activator NlpD
MYTDFIRLSSKPALDAGQPAAADKKKLADASAQFEAVLLSQMFDAMQKTAHFDEDGEEGGSSAPYADMIPSQMAQSLASAGGLGLAPWLEARLQGPASPGRQGSSFHPLPQRGEGVQASGPRDLGISPFAPRVDGGLPSPIHGAISSPFGEVRHREDGSVHVHQGIDIPAPQGTPIQTVASGRVSFSGKRQGYGETVEIEHADGTMSRYAHCSRRLVEAGQSVKRGETIAEVGSTGRSTGPHLHFEVLLHGRAVDPTQLLAATKKEGASKV